MARQRRGESKNAKASLSKVRALEVPVPERSQFADPEWPQNLSDLPGEDLSEHMTYWSAQIAYVNVEIALCDVERKAFEVERGVAYTHAYLASPTDKVTDRREHANADKDVQHAGDRHGVFDAQYRLLSALLKGYEQKYAACSREQSRREAQQARGRGL